MSPGALPSTSPDVRCDGVLLSAWEEEDLPAVLEIADDPDTRRWSGSLREVQSLEDARRWLAERGSPDRVDWAVRDPGTRAGFGYEGTEWAALDHGDGPPRDMHRHARLATDPPGPVEPGPVPLVVPLLAADGLRLRPWREEDAAAYLRGIGDPSATRWSPHRPPRTLDDGRRRLEQARGRGVASRALRLASTHAVEVLGLHRVQLQHAVGNAASCRVAEKAGFTLEGTRRGSCLLPEGFVDEHLHARVAR